MISNIWQQKITSHKSCVHSTGGGGIVELSPHKNVCNNTIHSQYCAHCGARPGSNVAPTVYTITSVPVLEGWVSGGPHTRLLLYSVSSISSIFAYYDPKIQCFKIKKSSKCPALRAASGSWQPCSSLRVQLTTFEPDTRQSMWRPGIMESIETPWIIYPRTRPVIGHGGCREGQVSELLSVLSKLHVSAPAAAVRVDWVRLGRDQCCWICVNISNKTLDSTLTSYTKQATSTTWHFGPVFIFIVYK